MAKRLDQPYRSGERAGMVKIKRLRTADCVVGGYGVAKNDDGVRSCRNKGAGAKDSGSKDSGSGSPASGASKGVSSGSSGSTGGVTSPDPSTTW